MESGDGLHEGQSGLQELLCRDPDTAADGDGQAKYANGFALTVHDDSLAEPLRWKQPQLVFVNSMSDLFHEDVPVGSIPFLVEIPIGSV